MKIESKTLALLAILISVILGGGVPALTKMLMAEMPPFSYTFIRFFIASLVLLPLFIRNKPSIHKDFYKVILFSLLLSANVILAPIGVTYTTATIAQTLYIFVPIIVAILSYFFFAERFTKQKVIGIVLCFVGAAYIILLPVIAKGTPFSGGLWGNVITIIAVLFTALYTIFSKPFQKHYTPIQLTSLFVFITCGISFFFLLSDLHTYPKWWENISTSAIVSLIYIAVLGTSLWYLLYQYAVKHGSPFIASMALYLQPMATVVWSFFLLGEQLTPLLLLGAAIAFSGVYLTLKKSKPQTATIPD